VCGFVRLGPVTTKTWGNGMGKGLTSLFEVRRYITGGQPKIPDDQRKPSGLRELQPVSSVSSAMMEPEE